MTSRKQLFELLSALCVYSPEGYSRAIDALEHYKVTHHHFYVYFIFTILLKLENMNMKTYSKGRVEVVSFSFNLSLCFDTPVVSKMLARHFGTVGMCYTICFNNTIHFFSNIELGLVTQDGHTSREGYIWRSRAFICLSLRGKVYLSRKKGTGKILKASPTVTAGFSFNLQVGSTLRVLCLIFSGVSFSSAM